MPLSLVAQPCVPVEPILNDPVIVPALGLVGRVSGRTIDVPGAAPMLDVLDAAGKVHPHIPAALARLIDDADCPVRRFGRPLALAPARRRAPDPDLVLSAYVPTPAKAWIRRLFNGAPRPTDDQEGDQT